MPDVKRAADWYAAWNARDPKRIAALYADDIEFASPFVAALGFGADGRLFGKAQFTAYVQTALPRVPDLRFEPIAVCAGAEGETLIYRNQSGVIVAESHEYDADGLITRASAAYEVNPKSAG
jgi:ketosteroid isomerase-like protein